jgi:hypothetical protein
MFRVSTIDTRVGGNESPYTPKDAALTFDVKAIEQKRSRTIEYRSKIDATERGVVRSGNNSCGALHRGSSSVGRDRLIWRRDHCRHTGSRQQRIIELILCIPLDQ